MQKIQQRYNHHDHAKERKRHFRRMREYGAGIIEDEAAFLSPVSRQQQAKTLLLQIQNVMVARPVRTQAKRSASLQDDR